jgi:Na+-translocating ferredoxin:NAD+ oxidoreductase subunit D
MQLPLSSPFLQQSRSVAQIMRYVLLALVPAVLLHILYMGSGIVIQLALAASTAALLEIAVLRLRGKAWRESLNDLSIFVLAALFVIAVPPYAPYWFTVGGVAFAVIIGKHIYGGLGGNVFNPAMAGYAFVLVSFPAVGAQWPVIDADAGFIGPLRAALYIFAPGSAVDAVSGATVLDYSRTQAALMMMRSEMLDAEVFGTFAGRSWEWINAGYLLGGVWLLYLKVIPWRIPAAVICGIAVPAMLFAGLDPELHAGALFHLFAGAALPAAFFIATDPVSSPTAPRAMLVFGFGVGLLTYCIREWGAYPDGVAFSILIMNALVPSLDRFFRPVSYGRRPLTGRDEG